MILMIMMLVNDDEKGGNSAEFLVFTLFPETQFQNF